MSSIPRTSGIYKIVCSANGKVYVGSATNLRNRRNYHWSMLQRGIHFNIHLQRSWNKHGALEFEFQIIEFTPKERLIETEQEHIDKLCSFDDRYGFNLRRVANSQIGFRHSDATRQRMSEARIGRSKKPLSDEHRQKLSAINLGKKHTAETCAKISASHKGKPKSLELREAARQLRKGIRPSDATILSRSKHWGVVDPDGNEQIVISLHRFCDEHGLNDSHMRAVADGKQRQHKGWKCYRIEEQ